MGFLVVVLDRKSQVIHQEEVNYKSLDKLSQYQIYTDKATKLKGYFDKHFKIVIKPCPEVPEGYIFWKPLHVSLGKWDNYLNDDPKRLAGVHEVISALYESGIVHVSFDYEGRTRHQSSSEVFVEYMKRTGFTNFKYEIGYNYHFKLWLEW